MDDRVEEDTFFDEDDEEFGRLLDEDVEEFDALLMKKSRTKAREARKERKTKKAKSAKGKRNEGSKKGKGSSHCTGKYSGSLSVSVCWFALFFHSHFMFFTKINGTDVSLKSVSAVEAYMEKAGR